jgi:hypothetical protein
MTVNLSGVYDINMARGAGQNYLTMWSAYSSTNTLAGFQLAKARGFNTVRIQIPAVTTAFDFPTPTSPELVNLTDCCTQAASAGVKLHVTLFNHFNTYGKITGAETWVSAIIGALNLSQVWCIELTNEIQTVNDPSSEGKLQYAGAFDAGWPGYPTIPTYGTNANWAGVIAMTWMTLLITYIQTVVAGSGVYVPSASTYSYLDLEDMVAGYAAAGVTVDWYEYHSYPKNPYSSANALSDLAGAIAAVTPAQIHIGEFGVDSDTFGQVAQAQWVQIMRNACNQKGLSEPTLWELYDQGVAGDNFGAYSEASVEKPLGYLYGVYPPGTPCPPLGSDRFFEVAGVRRRLAGPAY